MGLFRRRKQAEEAAAPPAPRLLSYRAANLQGVGTRKRQEDSFAFVNAMDVTMIRREGLLAIVADGMGGMEDGKLVSQGAVSLLTESFSRMDRGADLAAQLQSSLLTAGDALFRRFGGSGGTTAAVCLLFDEKLYWASVGDSYLYLKRGEGLYRLNRDQNYRAELYLRAVRDGVLSSAEADADPDGSRLSEFLGKDEIGSVDCCLRPLSLEDGDKLLLCSDGVGGVLTEDDLLLCLRGDPANACSCIEAGIRAAARVHQDNYTALVLECGY